MADTSLSKRVRTHYEARAFSPALIERLCAEIERRTGDSGVEIASGWRVSVERLLETFEPIHKLLKERPRADMKGFTVMRD